MYENVAENTGWGIYYRFLVTIGCLCFFATSIVVINVPIALTLASCDLKYKEYDIIALSSTFSLGLAFGSYFFGCLIDQHGRKIMLPVLLFIQFFGCFSSGFSAVTAMLQICIFITATGLSAVQTCIKVYISECMPIKNRARSLIFMDLSWSFGYILSLIVCRLIVPTISNYTDTYFRITSWRVLFALAAICPIMTSCMTALILPSPRFLLMKKKYQEAVEVLKHVYAVNFSQHADTFPLMPQDIYMCIKPYQFEEDIRPDNCTESCLLTIRRIIPLTARVFHRKHVYSTLAAIIIKIVVFPDLFSIHMLSTKYLHDIKNSQLENFTTFEFGKLNVLYLKPIEIQDGSYCISKNYDEVFSTALKLSLGIIIGQLFALFAADRVGRRFTIYLCCCICSMTIVTISAFLENSSMFPIVLLFLIGYAGLQSTLDVVFIESFPTAIRGTANGFVRIFGRLVCSIYQLYGTCSLFNWIYGIFIIAIGVPASFLPSLEGRPMIE